MVSSGGHPVQQDWSPYEKTWRTPHPTTAPCGQPEIPLSWIVGLGLLTSRAVREEMRAMEGARRGCLVVALQTKAHPLLYPSQHSALLLGVNSDVEGTETGLLPFPRLGLGCLETASIYISGMTCPFPVGDVFLPSSSSSLFLGQMEDVIPPLFQMEKEMELCEN